MPENWCQVSIKAETEAEVAGNNEVVDSKDFYQEKVVQDDIKDFIDDGSTSEEDSGDDYNGEDASDSDEYKPYKTSGKKEKKESKPKVPISPDLEFKPNECL